MLQICPKCSYIRQQEDQGDPGVCPACGLIFAKYLDASAKRDAARISQRQAAVPVARPWSPLVKILLILVLIAGAANLYLNRLHPPANFKHVNLPVVHDTAQTSENFEFMDLFDRDTSLASLAVAGRYTVVEVYLDDCAYCRELESALVTFQEHRKDVDVIRIHHPGHINASVQASTRDELNEKLKALNAKMASYQLCGSPHVEVYGPDKQALSADTCKLRGGTNFMWNWITTETGIVRHSAPGLFTSMS